MGKTLKYVSDFTFPSDCGFSGSAGKTMVKGYARGGAADIKQDKARVKAAVQKHERARHPGEPMTKLARGGMADGGMAMRKQYPTDRKEPLITRTKAPAAPAPKSDMLYSKKEVAAKNVLDKKVAPPLPHARGSVNMAKGGMTPKQEAKVGKVMGEFKSGELHSGSKSGPLVKDRKQAIAIGLSEARAMKAKK